MYTGIGKMQVSVMLLMMLLQRLNLAGTRNDRFFDKIRAKLAIITLNSIMKTNVWMQEPGSIIAFYLVDEQKGINVMEVINAMSENVIYRWNPKRAGTNRQRESETGKQVLSHVGGQIKSILVNQGDKGRMLHSLMPIGCQSHFFPSHQDQMDACSIIP